MPESSSVCDGVTTANIVGCSYVAGLFASAHDTHSGVRKEVCTGLVQMLQLQPERLAAHMDQIIEYMLESTQVRLAAHFFGNGF